MSSPLIIYTDGSCKPNPGAGGWAFVIKGSTHFQCGNEAQTTNNRMELRAIAEALQWALSTAETGRVEIVTDSAYAKNGIESWIHGWKRNGWKTARGRPVLNQDLWTLVDTTRNRLGARQTRVVWKWVKGHSNDSYNCLADVKAKVARILLSSLK